MKEPNEIIPDTNGICLERDSLQRIKRLEEYIIIRTGYIIKEAQDSNKELIQEHIETIEEFLYELTELSPDYKLSTNEEFPFYLDELYTKLELEECLEKDEDLDVLTFHIKEFLREFLSFQNEKDLIEALKALQRSRYFL